MVAFRRLAEICGEYLKKGKQVYIEGKIQTRSWEDKDGNKRYTTEIVADQMKMLGKRDEESGESYSSPSPQNSAAAVPSVTEDDDDLPF